MTQQNEHDASTRVAFEPLVKRLRSLESDHTPEGYPAVQMRDISRILDAMEFYRRRCDLLQANQRRMRDPERTLICDILANGALLPDPTGERYGGAFRLTADIHNRASI